MTSIELTAIASFGFGVIALLPIITMAVVNWRRNVTTNYSK